MFCWVLCGCWWLLVAAGGCWWSLCGWPGMSRFGVITWTGDISPSWDDLVNTPGYILNWGLMGTPYVACDTGGFSGETNALLLTRWYQVSCPFIHVCCAGPSCYSARCIAPRCLLPHTRRLLSTTLLSHMRAVFFLVAPSTHPCRRRGLLCLAREYSLLGCTHSSAAAAGAAGCSDIVLLSRAQLRRSPRSCQ
jgi:hypothetical protein